MDAIPNEVYGIGCVVVAVVGFILISRAAGKMQAELERRLAEATPAEAEILAVRTAPMQNSNRVRTSVLLTLRVFPPDGGAPYESIGAWQLDTMRAPEVQPGRKVPVKVASDDPQTIFPAMEGVTYDLGNHRIWLNEQERQEKA